MVIAVTVVHDEELVVIQVDDELLQLNACYVLFFPKRRLKGMTRR